MTWATLVAGTLLTGCLDPPLTDEARSELDADVRGILSLQLNTGAQAPVEVLAIRIVESMTNETVRSETLNLAQDSLALETQLDPGDYVVRLRGVTPSGQVCSGSGSFRVNAGELAGVEVVIACDSEPLAVGQARVTIATQSGVVKGSGVMRIDGRDLTSAHFAELQPGRYVVWVTASTLAGSPCAGSSDLLIEPGVTKAIDLAVICEQ